MKKTSKIKLVTLAISGVFVLSGISARIINPPEPLVTPPDPNIYLHCKVKGKWVTAKNSLECKERFEAYELG